MALCLVTSLRCRVQRVNEWRSGGEQSAGAARTTHGAPGAGRGGAGWGGGHQAVTFVHCKHTLLLIMSVPCHQSLLSPRIRFSVYFSILEGSNQKIIHILFINICLFVLHIAHSPFESKLNSFVPSTFPFSWILGL